jgi:hypothetical protein
MLVILIFGLWLGQRVNHAREQRMAVAAIKADKGWVHYADEFTMGPVNVPAGNALWKPGWGTLASGNRPLVPAAIRRAIGDEYFRELAHVSLFVDIQKGSATAPNDLAKPLDEVLELLRGQSTVKTLHLGGPTVTDQGLRSVAELHDLRELVIWWATAFSDDGIAHLSRLPRLRLLDISLSTLGDESLRHLAELPALEDLTLEGRKFTDRGLSYLAKAKQLRRLTLRMDESEITDAGLETLQGLTNLRHLHLQNTQFSQAARDRIRKVLPNLELIP